MNIIRIRPAHLAVMLFLCLLVVGCGPQSATSTGLAEEPAADAPTAPPAALAAEPAPAQPAPRPAAQPSTPKPRATQPAPKPAAAAPRPTPKPRPTYETLYVPAGTEIEVELLETLSSGTSQIGDPVRARLANDLRAEGRLIAAAGSELFGSVSNVVPLKNFGGRPKISVEFASLQLDSGDSVSVFASHSVLGKKQGVRDAAKIGGATIAGAVLGHQVDDDKGTEIGAVVGGAVGTAVAAKTGKEVEIVAGTRIIVSLQDEVEVRLPS